MLSFSPPHSTLPRHTDWPDSEVTSPATVFSPRPRLRKLVIVVDQQLLDAASQGGQDFTPTILLAGLLTHPHLRLLRYSDEGPPDDLPRRESGLFPESVDGWLMVINHPEESGDQQQLSVLASDGRTVTNGSIVLDFVRAAESDDRTQAYADRGADERIVLRRADLIAAQAAHVAGADMFITGREYLHAATRRFADGTLIARPDDALPLVSLYLRTQGEYNTWRSLDGTGSSTMNRGLFYWVGARELLPAGWRWFSACLQHARATGDDQMIYLAQSLFQRVQRALQARDDAYVALNCAQNNDTADSALGSLDQVLLGLMAAIDVTARVAHFALDLPANQLFNAGWQRARWRKLVEEGCAPLAELTAQGTSHGHTLTIASKLRNSVHGAALNALAVGDAGARRQGTLVGLPHGDADQLVEAMDACGGRAEWGVQELLPGRFHADPGVLMDRLFRAVIGLLNDLQGSTPVEWLSGVHLREEDSLPPSEGPMEAAERESVRWQLGLS
jgi:hypothetical protein